MIQTIFKEIQKEMVASPVANSYMMQPSKMIATYAGKVQGSHLQGNFIIKPLSCDFKLSIFSKPPIYSTN